MSCINKNMPVAINRCTKYELELVRETLKKQFDSIIVNEDILKNKNVVVKPNLLMKSSPEKSITTHPIVLEAVIDILKNYSPKSITIAESPGGPYTPTTLGIIYKSTGISAVAEKCNVILNFDTSSKMLKNPEGCVCKNFNIISPIADADVVVNVCKLKTHSLTTMSASVKNLFGTIPGIEKFEMHTRYKDIKLFEEMLYDLCAFHCKNKPMICVVDAIKGMEGNGPSGGDVREFGLLLSSLNPFNLDIACSAVLGMEGKIGYIEHGKKADVAVKLSSELRIIGEEITKVAVNNVKLPESQSLPILKKLPTMFGGRLNRFLEPKPEVIKNKCIGCGECKRSCPAKTIELVTNNKGKRIAKINDENCIKCYCCQELCPINAVRIKKNPIFKLIK